MADSRWLKEIEELVERVRKIIDERFDALDKKAKEIEEKDKV